jgi:hypothetical protein
MVGEKFKEIGRFLILEGFECEHGNFKGATLSDREPV